MSQRRYRDDEVREIFELATTDKTSEPPTASPREGLTLAEMQSIGQEVGLAPDVVARAAAAFEAGAPRDLRTSWGVPIEVGLTVPLPRAPTDLEWEQLVSELRETFHARGKITTLGGLREWRNGNLHAAVEPTEAGYRLRLGTLKSSAARLNTTGAISVVASSAVLASLALSGNLGPGHVAALLAPVLMGSLGIGALLSNRIRLPQWARRRDEQMKHIAARIRSIMGIK